jgi:hypothetical protein
VFRKGYTLIRADGIFRNTGTLTAKPGHGRILRIGHDILVNQQGILDLILRETALAATGQATAKKSSRAITVGRDSLR